MTCRRQAPAPAVEIGQVVADLLTAAVSDSGTTQPVTESDALPGRIIHALSEEEAKLVLSQMVGLGSALVQMLAARSGADPFDLIALLRSGPDG